LKEKNSVVTKKSCKTNNYLNHIGSNINNNNNNYNNNNNTILNAKNDDNMPAPMLKPNVSITTVKDESTNHQKCKNNNGNSNSAAVQSTATILVSKKSKIKVKYPLLV
jgi:hypothetical protein